MASGALVSCTRRVPVVGPALVGRLILRADLVPGGGLPREPQAAVLVEFLAVGRPAQVGRIRRARRRQVVIDSGNGLLRRPIAIRPPEPHPIPHDGTAKRRIEVVDLPDRRRGGQAARPQVVVEIVALQVVIGVRPHEESLERVAAVARHQIESHPADFSFRRETAGLDRDLLHSSVVGGDRHELPAAALSHVVLHPIVERGHLVQAAPVNGEPLSGKLRSADVLTGTRHAGNEHANLAGRLHPDRDRVEHVSRHHLLLHDVLHVHRRRLSGDRDGLARASRRAARR